MRLVARREARRALSYLLRKQLVADVARRRRQPQPSGLAPGGLVDLLLVSDLQLTGCLHRQENRVVHLPPGSAVFPLEFLPELQLAELEIWQLFPDLTAKALPLALTGTLSAAWKHPEPVAPSANQQYASLF